MNPQKLAIRSLVRGAYDLQQLRIQMGLRIVSNFKAKLGQQPNEKESELNAEAKLILKMLRDQYRRITDAAIGELMVFEPDSGKLMNTETEKHLVGQYLKIEQNEVDQFKAIERVLKEYPIWTEWLVNVKGVGRAMAGVIISELDPHIAKYPSSFWKYAGLDVAAGSGRSRRKEHLIDREYVNKEGETKTKKSITYNPFLKSKMLGVLATSFLMHKTCHYRGVYDQYRHRIDNHPNHADKTKGHRKNMAMRYMVKMFLQDLHIAWRRIEGLPVSTPYEVAKLAG